MRAGFLSATRPLYHKGSQPIKHGTSYSHTGFLAQQKNFYLSPGETELVTIRMIRSGKTLEAVVITEEKERRENSLVKVNPKTALTMPSTTGGVEALIKTLVGSNNELTSQYNVRGGNYDENIVYINDYEVYRPYLVSNGQQKVKFYQTRKW
jgi:hypothetical protein